MLFGELMMPWSRIDLKSWSFRPLETLYQDGDSWKSQKSWTPGTHKPGWGEVRLLESLTPGNIMPGRNGKLKPPESLMDPMESLTEAPG